MKKIDRIAINECWREADGITKIIHIHNMHRNGAIKKTIRPNLPIMTTSFTIGIIMFARLMVGSLVIIYRVQWRCGTWTGDAAGWPAVRLLRRLPTRIGKTAMDTSRSESEVDFYYRHRRLFIVVLRSNGRRRINRGDDDDDGGSGISGFDVPATSA